MFFISTNPVLLLLLKKTTTAMLHSTSMTANNAPTTAPATAPAGKSSPLSGAPPSPDPGVSIPAFDKLGVGLPLICPSDAIDEAGVGLLLKLMSLSLLPGVGSGRTGEEVVVPIPPFVAVVTVKLACYLIESFFKMCMAIGPSVCNGQHADALSLLSCDPR